MRNILPIFTILVLIALAVLLLAVAPSNNQRFDRSPLGSRGLELWLKSQGVEVVRSNPHLAPNSSDMSIRVLPLREANSVRSSKEHFEPGVLEEKHYEMPTLVALPKWKDDVANEGIAKEAMLIPANHVQGLIAQLYSEEISLVRQGARFEQMELSIGGGEALEVALYRAQLFDRATLPDYCTELAGFPAGVLLMSCELNIQVYALSDPDLINNHGLATAENAGFVASMIKALRGASDQRPVYLDTDATLFSENEAEGEGRTYERTASDLKRLFDYPLSVIWATALLVTAIAFWRGAYRFGPPRQKAAVRHKVSKTAAIEAVARLLRLSGNDGRMTAQFVHDLLADKAVQVFGSGNAASTQRLFDWLALRDAQHASALRTVYNSLIEQGPTMRRADLHRNLDAFKELLGSTDLGPK